MSMDIGAAVEEGISRTLGRNGLLLAAAFAVVALVTTVLTQTMTVGLLETMLETFEGMSPQELQVPQSEYEQLLADLRTQLETARETSPLALGLPAGVAAAGLLVTALVAEAVSIAAVRVFAAADSESVSRGDVTDGLLFATANGFVGGIAVWGLIVVGSVFLLIPGLFFAVVFYFLRQEVALEGKNFVEAMADSWRLTKGHRFSVLALGLLVVVITQLQILVGTLFGLVPGTAGQVLTTVATVAVGGVLAVFGAATVTRGYVQLRAGEELDADGGSDNETNTDSDPYDAPLGADDIPE